MRPPSPGAGLRLRRAGCPPSGRAHPTAPPRCRSGNSARTAGSGRRPSNPGHCGFRAMPSRTGARGFGGQAPVCRAPVFGQAGARPRRRSVRWTGSSAGWQPQPDRQRETAARPGSLSPPAASPAGPTGERRRGARAGLDRQPPKMRGNPW